MKTTKLFLVLSLVLIVIFSFVGTASAACVGEGRTIPLILRAPKCCTGLSLIKPMSASMVGISGICTAKCGNGVCNSATETTYNCPQDCKVTTACVREGGTVPLIPRAPKCCAGLHLVLPSSRVIGIMGVCTR